MDIGAWAQHPGPRTTKSLALPTRCPCRGLSLPTRSPANPSMRRSLPTRMPGTAHTFEKIGETRASTLAAAMEIKKKSAGPVDQREHKETEAEFLDRINPSST